MSTTIEATPQNEANRGFWEMICGSDLARSLGASDCSIRSLCVFDNYYTTYYPYLLDWIPFQDMAGKDVLEVGLGYGTVGQMLAAARANYTGLDVAAAPVGLMNLRLRTFGLGGRAVEGSVLDAPFAAASFDYVVAIGSLHHTGNLERAVSEAQRVLRPGGRLVMMVYYGYSYKMWALRGRGMVKELLRDMLGGASYGGDSYERFRYDANEQGDGAPHTVFTSKRQLRRLAERVGLGVERAATENVGPRSNFKGCSRKTMLRTVGKIAGVDLYAVLRKAA